MSVETPALDGQVSDEDGQAAPDEQDFRNGEPPFSCILSPVTGYCQAQPGLHEAVEDSTKTSSLPRQSVVGCGWIVVQNHSLDDPCAL